MSGISYPLPPPRATRGLSYYLRVLRVVGVIEFKKNYAGATLGYVWSLLRPLLLFGVLYVVFSEVVRVGAGVPRMRNTAYMIEPAIAMRIAASRNGG